MVVNSRIFRFLMHLKHGLKGHMQREGCILRYNRRGSLLHHGKEYHDGKEMVHDGLGNGKAGH